MELIVLGACGTWANAGGACSGYLVRHDGYTIWIDMGAGTLANLHEHIDPLDVDAVIISHSHPDHLVDLYPYFYARHYALGRPHGTPLWCPAGLFGRAGKLLSEESLFDLAHSFHVQEIDPGEGFEAGPFTVETRPMAHPVPTLGIRLEAGGRSLAYTADSGATPEVPKLARGVDLLLADATWQGDPAQYTPNIHMTSGEAGEAAREAEPGTLMLTHIWPTFDKDRSVEEAAAAFAGPILLAREGMKLEVGS